MTSKLCKRKLMTRKIPSHRGTENTEDTRRNGDKMTETELNDLTGGIIGIAIDGSDVKSSCS